MTEAAVPPRSCPLCSNRGASRLCEVSGHIVWRCAGCCFDFVSPLPTSEELEAYYDRPAWFEAGERGGYQNYDEQSAWSIALVRRFLESYPPGAGQRSVLDLGCAYGNHLAVAAGMGWDCVGVEPSQHAREIAASRLGGRATILGSVAELGPRPFDLILLLDVLEHLAEPLETFADLQRRGAITPETRVVVSTPNARSVAALADPCGWEFRHPPAHLGYFSAEALTRFFTQLGFREIAVEGLHEPAPGGHDGYPDESSELNRSLAGHPGLLCIAAANDRAGAEETAADGVHGLRRGCCRLQIGYFRALGELERLRAEALRHQQTAERARACELQAELDRELIAEQQEVIGRYAASLPVRFGDLLSRFRVVRLAAAALRAGAAGLDPASIPSRLRRLRGQRRRKPDALTYRVRAAAPPAGAPLVVHALANMMTGGSSRLVVDLIESLGERYAQTVLTSLSPDPPAYHGLDLTEMPGVPPARALDAYFSRRRPALLHLHYWGECDRPWYERVAAAAERSGVPILENVNTPVAPLLSPGVRSYVFVSEYVLRAFGRGGRDETVVYPGSDFRLFAGDPQQAAALDSVGMVYRLEADKLDPRAIDPFIALARMRTSTRVYIVGGGSYLKPFRAAVASAGLEDRFEFPGYVPYETLPEWYRRFGVFVAPVFKESFGQVSPFAMSMGIPVVGYDTGAIAEIVGDPRLVAPTGRAQELAAIAAGLLGDAQRRLAEGRRQQERAHRHFSLEAMIAAYRELYRDLTRGGGRCA